MRAGNEAGDTRDARCKCKAGDNALMIEVQFLMQVTESSQ